MDVTADRVVAVVGLGAVLPDARNVKEFWENITRGRYSISDLPADRWDPELYFDPDPKVPDKTYSRIGGWVRECEWDPVKWRLPVPPRVSEAMDWTQKWAIGCTLQALTDFGYPKRPLDVERTAVILGNAMGGEQHNRTTLRTSFPEYARELEKVPAFASLPRGLREVIRREWHAGMGRMLPPVTEDSMPGELSNCIAGRLANLFNFRGPNFVADAACASAMAAMSAAVEGLIEKRYDAVITGGVDRNMGPPTFIKFCKIGALSATGSRPYADGADGFVMGEGAAIFLMKRLSDAERDGDRIYAVLRGIGGSSDGKGKGITAPNPVGQRLAVSRAWENAGLSPSGVGLIEGHGTSTAVGDLAEIESLIEVFGKAGCARQSVALGSVKSNIGHLKSAAGAAGVLKAVLALHEKVLPPTVKFHKPNPGVDFAASPFRVATDLRPWESTNGHPRQVGVSAFGFGGTNFHVVLEEHVPGRFASKGRSQVAYEPKPDERQTPTNIASVGQGAKPPLRGALVVGAANEHDLADRLRLVARKAQAGEAPPPSAPAAEDLQSAERVAIDYGTAAELAEKASRAVKALDSNVPAMWKALRAQGVFRGRGPRGKVAFLYTGQGSQYLHMLDTLRKAEPIVAETFVEADAHTMPLLGRPISEFLFVDASDKTAAALAEEELRQTAITQPAVLTVDYALTRLLAAYGVVPDMVMGHSLGEYGALVACGAMPFRDALEAVSARGREMTRVSFADNGWMVAVFAPLGEIERVVREVGNDVVIANINSTSQAVIGGPSAPVERAMKRFLEAGYTAVRLPVSHAFHTSIVAPASAPLCEQLKRLHLESPHVPIVSNVTGEFYPMGPGVAPQMVDLLGRQIAAPVQFVKGLQTLFDAGARLFVEAGPKKALQGFAEEAFADRPEALSVFTNHPKFDDLQAFNIALCGAYAMGHGTPRSSAAGRPIEVQSSWRPLAASAFAEASTVKPAIASNPAEAGSHKENASRLPAVPHGNGHGLSAEQVLEIGRVFASAIERGLGLYQHGGPAASTEEPVVITGASIGLPGTPRVFDDGNVARILRGEVFLKAIPDSFRKAMAEKRVTRLVKSSDGMPRFETIDKTADVVKVAGRAGELDLAADFGVPADRLPAFDPVTRLAIGAGLDALRDAGIPLVQHYKRTTKGTLLPDRWGLPDALRDDTGIIFTSAFPGLDSYTEIIEGYYRDRLRREKVSLLEELRALTNGESTALRDPIEWRLEQISAELEREPYVFDRRFLLRVLAMGHSQFAEIIGARGPNTQINSACASSTMALGMAEDWIRAGRCRRVIIIGADDITSDNLMEWFGAGFLASGAAATDERAEDAALPFDRRRHGLLIGMGAAGVVIESADAARERGLQPICEIIETVSGNSAFHGTRLDLQHIAGLMETLVARVEAKTGVSRKAIAERLLFVSHETYTPARGGSASAEVTALRRVFGDDTDKVVVANSKGYTGHPMAVGIEDVLAVKSLETGIVPPVAHYKELDPELGPLNLSRGGTYPVEWAMRLGAGFGSQISLSVMRWTPLPDGARRAPDQLGYAYRIVDRAAWTEWLRKVSGQTTPELEVDHRTLHVKDQAAAPPVRPVVQPTPQPVTQPAPQLKTQPTVQAGIASAGVIAQAARPAARIETPRAPVTGPAAPIAHLVAARDPVKEKILALVVEKTGYPAEMLDLDLDLEADLGVDTVKQAELMAAIRGIYEIPRDDRLKLRDFPTLNHVIRFVYERRPDLKPAVQASVPGSSSVVPGAHQEPGSERPHEEPGTENRDLLAADSVKDRILALVVDKTGYPAEMLDLDLDLEADLGVDTVKQAELMAAIRGIYEIPRDDRLKLRDFPTLNHVIRFVYERRPDLKPVVQASVPGSSSVVPGAHQEPGTEHPHEGPGTENREPLAADSVKDRILALVVDKTDYPAEMLDLDLDLEADLGVDTVKQAELMAAIRGIYEIPRDDRLKLRDFPTLNHVIKFVYDKRPDLKAPIAPQEPGTRSGQEEPGTGNEKPAVARTLSPVSSDPVKDRILALVVDKTGYPAEMLDLDLDLEADLGVDTVKQAELMAAIRGIYEIPRDDRLKLRDFPTLNHVIRFVHDRRPDLEAAGAHPEPAPRNQEPAIVPMSFDAANRIPRRVPTPVVRPPVNFCKPTAVTLATGRRVIVMADHGGVAASLIDALTGRGVTSLVIDEALSDDRFDAQIAGWLAEGPITGVYWLPALDLEPDLESMTFDTWRQSLRARVQLLYRLMRALYEHIDHEEAFLVAGTRCGGEHGYDAPGALSTLGGAVTGFTKALKRERSRAMVKAVDFGDQSPMEIAASLVDETLRDPGIVEVGHRDGVRWAIGLSEQKADESRPAIALSKDSVFVITGAAGSIVSAIVTDLAAASGGVFYLFDRVAEPNPADPDLARFTDDKEGLKRDIAARLKSRGERPTPVMVERELAAIERSHAALKALQAVEQCGGIAVYTSVDLTDGAAVARAIETVREQNGRIDVLVHAAGIEISRFLPEKEPAEFDRVLEVKATGWFNLLKAIDDMPLASAVVFSSIAGRFGNGGQTDYSAANDLLCKSISNFRRTRPETRGIAIDWTAWSGIGMASRGSIPKMMEMAGIDMLPPEAGVPVVRRELIAAGPGGEVVIAGRLGVMLQEFDPVGVDNAAAVQEYLRGSGPMIGRLEQVTPSGVVVVETTLDPRVQPFLFDHQIDGTPVLPGVMGVEAFAELAGLLVPDHHVVAVEDMQFHAAFKFFRNEPRALRLEAQLVPGADGITAHCRLIGTRMLGKQAERQETVHFTGRVQLARSPLEPPAIQPPAQLAGQRIGAPDIYRVYFHGPAFQVVDSAWRHDAGLIGRFGDDLPAPHVPVDRPVLLAPRLLELCLQTAGLWDVAMTGRMSLPHRIERIAAFQPTESTQERLFAVVRPDDTRKAFDADVVDSTGRVLLSVRGYQTIEIPGGFDEAALKPLAAALSLDGRHSPDVGVAVEMR